MLGGGGPAPLVLLIDELDAPVGGTRVSATGRSRRLQTQLPVDLAAWAVYALSKWVAKLNMWFPEIENGLYARPALIA